MIGTLLLAAASVSPAVDALLPGIYANAEQVRLAAAGQPLPPWTGVRITGTAPLFMVQAVDAFGADIGPVQRWRVRQTPDLVAIATGNCVRDFARVSAGLTIINQTAACNDSTGPTTFTAAGMAMRTPDGLVLELQRGRGFTCSAALPRPGAAAGQTEWTTVAGLQLHDAGGRVRIDAAAPPRFSLRLHHIGWPMPPEQPRLVLEAYAGDADPPIGASWADPAATRLGIDLPGLRARCALDAAPPVKKPG
jgi:hypothetical protein